MTGNDQMSERYELVMERIRQITKEDAFGEPLLSYFTRTASFVAMLSDILERSRAGTISEVSTADLAAENHRLYEDILGDNYKKSFADPDYAVRMFEEADIPDAKQIARYLSFVYTEMRGLIPYAFEGRSEIFTIYAELFVEVHTAFRLAAVDGASPKADSVREIICSFESDNCDIVIPDNVADKIDPANDFLRRIVCEADLDDDRFLYLSGEYVGENEKGIAAFLRALPEDEIKLIADTYTQAYRTGFVTAGKPIDKKTSAEVRYPLGFERIIREAVALFDKMGLASVIHREGTLSLTSSGTSHIGFIGGIPNRQYVYDHKDDEAIYLDADFVTRKLEVLTDSYENMKVLANGHAGPAVMEEFGEEPFTPVVKENAIAHSEKTRKLAVDYGSRAASIVNKYIIGEERSFTIIAFPIPEIGKDFEKIFEETVRINTLPYKKYQNIQQHMIDALDTAHSVRIKGAGQNVTDLTINLHELTDPAKQTNFENCVADVNIPVGEVFTSPKLSGTNGVLNVTKVYLKGLLYRNLKITFSDGMVKDYTCDNYDSEEDNRKFIRENLLNKHESLPIGEFAIGTNTTAYRMGRDYDIEGLLPILIGEKTGPHFALGDTCYKYEEDVPAYNPDGKEIIARENEVSAKRKTNIKEAYFQCHTDITIPYDELEYIRAVTPDGHVSIIENGRFVLPGTEELNEPLEGMDG